MGHIAVELRASPAGAVLAGLKPLGANIAPFIPEFANVEYPVLSLVDPYGDTYFSSYQMSGVILEIERLLERNPDPLLSQLLDIAATCKGTPHSYLVFLGD